MVFCSQVFKFLKQRKSFEELPSWIEECDVHLKNKLPRILIGNKCDRKDEKQV